MCSPPSVASIGWGSKMIIPAFYKLRNGLKSKSCNLWEMGYNGDTDKRRRFPNVRLFILQDCRRGDSVK